MLVEEAVQVKVQIQKFSRAASGYSMDDITTEFIYLPVSPKHLMFLGGSINM